MGKRFFLELILFSCSLFSFDQVFNPHQSQEPKEKRKKQKRKEINVAFEEILPYIQEKHSFLDRNFLQQFLGKVVTICLISDPAHRPSACDVCSFF